LFVTAAIFAPGLGWESPKLVWRVGLILNALGSVCLVGLMRWVYPQGQRLTAETVLGFVTLLIGMLCLIAALGNEEKQLGVFWLVMAAILIPVSMAQIMLSAIKSRKPGEASPAMKDKPARYKRFY
jgi:multisubunit Na+/H+ antiporter MnhG subunit